MTRQRYAGYKYIGLKPYILIIKGEVYKLKRGGYVELLPEKLKTRKLKRLLKVIYK